MNKHNYMIRSLLFSLLVLDAPGLLASDMEKEKRWEAQIVDNLLTGEAVKLKAGAIEILGLYTPSAGKQVLGGAIVLHGIGAHPAWPEVIEPLRTQLPEHGWHTLSLQLPILPNDAKAEDYAPLFGEVAPRINAGITYLKQKGIKNIVIVAHSLGAAMSSAYLADKPDPAIHAFVGIGMGAVPGDPRMDNAISLGKIKVPVLDIFGSMDLQPVIENARARSDAAKKAGNKNFTQTKVAGADHFFNQMDDELVKRVRGWLARNAVK